MSRYFYLTILFVLMLLTTGAYAVPVPDTTDTDDDTEGMFDDEDWGNWKRKKWNWDMDFDAWRGFDQPAIRASYGLNRTSVKDFTTTFGDVRSLEARIGYVDVDPYRKNSYLVDYEFNYFNYYRGASSIDKRVSTGNEITAELVRLGVGWEKGIGYRIGDAALIPYTSYAIGWTKANIQNIPVAGISALESERLNFYHDKYKFGVKTESGIILQPIRNVSVSAAMEKSLIYPRILTWKMGGSYMVEGIGQHMIDEFMEKVIDNSPFVAPILNVALKSALTYYLFEMRREEMNFPFEGVAPLYHEDFKLSVNFIF
ncbi:MAG: hypothetical protein HUU54_00160 [Ignavibacteriaceae bacterium]|nr:hypothetical protein [Ignavibacteriaceae bacterium]